MDNNKKKVLVIPFDEVLTTKGTLDVRKDVCDKIKEMPNVQYVIILAEKSSDQYYNARIKAVEFFVFVYCSVAVITYKDEADTDNIMALLPHNIKKKDYILSIGNEIKGFDNIDLVNFI